MQPAVQPGQKNDSAADQLLWLSSRTGWDNTSAGWSQDTSKSVQQTAFSSSAHIGTWQNPSHSWRPASHNASDIIVDTQDREAWPSIGGQIESASDSTGDIDNASAKSGSVISSSSNPSGRLGDASSQGTSAIQGHESASSVWAVTNSSRVDDKMESSSVWGENPGGSAFNSVWGSSQDRSAPTSTGHTPNMQGSQSSSTPTNTSSTSLGWSTNNETTASAFSSAVGTQSSESGASSSSSSVQASSSSSMWQGMNLGTGVSSLQQQQQAANQGSSWDRQDNGISVMSSGLSISSPITGDNPHDSKGASMISQTDQWSRTSSGSSGGGGGGWGNPSPKPDSSTGWGSPCPSPAPNAGTEMWGRQDKETSGWSQTSASSKPSGWGQADKQPANPSSSWGQPQPASKAQQPSGWSGGNPSPNPTSRPAPPSSWGQNEKPAAGAWGAPGEKPAAPSQLGIGGAGAASNTSQWASVNTPVSNAQGGGWADPNMPKPIGTQPQTGQQTPTQPQSGSWAQAARGGLPANTSDVPNQADPGQNRSRPMTKEELIAQVVNSNDGWGKTRVRQDTAWDVEQPSRAPVQQPKPAPAPQNEEPNTWNQPNTGTAIWEGSKESGNVWGGGSSNASNEWGGSGSGSTSGSDNDGGTWGGGGGGGSGNDSNVWTGPPGSNNSNQWGSGNNSSNTWGGGPPRRSNSGNWGSSGSSTDSNWENNKSDNVWQGERDHLKDNMWDRNGTHNWGEAGSGGGGGGGGGPPGGPSGPPGGASGRTETGTWMQGHSRSSSSSWDDEGQGWSGGQRGPGPSSGPPPSVGPPVNAPRPTVDDGTAYWGEPKQAGWNNSSGPPSTPQPPQPMMGQRDPSWGQPQGKPAGWGEPGQGMMDDWGRSMQQPKPGGWGDNAQWPGGVKPKTGGGWGESSDWNSANKGASFGVGRPHYQMRSQMLQNLMDMGFKKEDAQNALIRSNMNLTEAMGYLMQRRPDSDLSDAQRGRQVRGMGSDDLVDRDGQMVPPMHNTPFGNAQAHLPTSPMMGNPMKQPGPGLHMTPSLGASSINPASVQPMLPQQLGKPPQNMPQGQPIRGQMTGNQPVHQNMLHQQQQHIVQQLRMAVQAGLISPQLLNQQLTPNMLVMLQHLLQAQQVLQQLVNQQQQLQKQRMNPLQQRQKLDQLGNYIQQVQQQIQTTQQNIKVAQQSLLTKQQPPQPQQQVQQQQLQSQVSGMTTPDVPKDPSKDLQNDMASMALKDGNLGGSRLKHWKLPSPEKDSSVPISSSENRPVGSRVGQQSHSTSNLQSSTSLPFSDNTWSSSSLSTTASWPTTSSSAISTTSVASGDQVESKNEAETSTDHAGNNPAPTSSASPITELVTSGNDTPTSSGDANAGLDLIEEFVPGKPWQGSGIKSVEDDPYITPGSITRSRLSVNTIKEDYLTNLGKTTNGSPTVGSDTLNSTWSLGPHLSKSSSSQNLVTDVKSTWSTTSGVDHASCLDPEFWAGSNVPKPRPPPGLGSKGLPQTSQGASQPGFSRSVSWAPGDRSAFTTMAGSWSGQTVSNCLILKNLSSQMDSSTLKTVCMQHGPLQTFQYNQHYGHAVVRYSSKEEAVKAQKSLNACMLNGASILAEFIPETELARMADINQVAASSASGPASSSAGSPWPSGAPPRSAPFNKTEGSPWNGAATNSVWGSSMWGLPEEPRSHGGALLPGDLLGGH